MAAETIRGWLSAYRDGGFDALRPKPRRDEGQPRAISQEIADLLCQLKEETPALSIRTLIEQVRTKSGMGGELVLAPATVHRLLSRQGLMDKRPTEPTSKDRRRFAYENAGEMWMSDVMHGPAVTTGNGRRRKSYLIALLDDATRVVPYAAFMLSENTTSFLPVLQQAILRRGIPKRLYVDNGAAYRSQQLSLVCAKLGVTLIHARPLPASRQGQAGTLVSVGTDAAPADARAERPLEPGRPQSPAVGLGRERVPLEPASGARRSDPAGPLGDERPGRAPGRS